ncbi:MAG: hypothetical protein WC627_08575 [Legionella sp.]|jgi:hypothetical protein
MFTKNDKSPQHLFDILEELSKNKNNLDVPSQFNKYHSIWVEVSSIESSYSLKTFCTNRSGATRFLEICRILNNKDQMIKVLDCIHRNREIVERYKSIVFLLYQNWLWLAINEPNETLVTYYLNSYAHIYTYLVKPSISHNSDNFYARAQIEENLVYALLKRPKPHTEITFNPKQFNHISKLHFAIQEFLKKAHSKTLTEQDYKKIIDHILTPKNTNSAFEIFSTNAHFITQKLHHELYLILENCFERLSEETNEYSASKIFSGQTIDKVQHWLIPITKWLVRIGIILDKERSILDTYIEKAEEILSRTYQYEVTKRNKETSINKMRLLKDTDTSLDTLAVQVENNFNPYSFMQAQNSLSGEEDVHNACILMNPFNPEFAPKKALEILKSAMEKTEQCGDIYLEYIRCNLLLNPNYRSQDDKDLIVKFERGAEHYGFLWFCFAKTVYGYNNDSQLLKNLETLIHHFVLKFTQAYQHPNDYSVLKHYSVHEFQTALGSPLNFRRYCAALNHQSFVHYHDCAPHFTQHSKYAFFVDSLCNESKELVYESNESSNDTYQLVLL